MACKPKILIVGSGPVGCTLGLSLLKNGVTARIIEKDATFHQGTRGPGVKPRTLEQEYFLGIMKDVEKHSISGSHFTVYDPEDPYHIIKSNPMAESVPPTPANPIGTPLTVPQHLHETVLRKHIAAAGGGVDLGVALIGLRQEDDGVTVDLQETKDGKVSTVSEKYDWVIGTDGGHSTVRKAVGIAFLGETREEERMYIIDCKVEGLVEKDMHSWATDSQERVVLRYTGQPKGFQVLYFGTNESMERFRAKDDAAIREAIPKAIKRPDISITDITWQGEWRANIRMAERFRSGRVFVAGDAAHTHSPAGGFGLNTGVMDAFNLGWKLALVVKGLASSALLDSYELERLPVVSEMLQISTGIHDGMRDSFKLATSDKPSSGEQPQPQAQPPADPWFRGRKLFMLDVNYRWSPIVLDERFDATEAAKQPNAFGTEGHEVRAGDRAPDAPNLHVVKSSSGSIGEETRLFDIFKPDKHTALLFFSDNSIDKTMDILGALAKYPSGLIQTALILHPNSSSAESSSDFVFRDVEGHARIGYGVKGNQIVIVRPDGVVGAFVAGADGLKKYFSLVFLANK